MPLNHFSGIVDAPSLQNGPPPITPPLPPSSSHDALSPRTTHPVMGTYDGPASIIGVLTLTLNPEAIRDVKCFRKTYTDPEEGLCCRAHARIDKKAGPRLL